MCIEAERFIWIKDDDHNDLFRSGYRFEMPLNFPFLKIKRARLTEWIYFKLLAKKKNKVQ